ncbi:MAG: hypothetical protein KTR30_15555 [Saprospiraceae bacterium]|nr:hypothetical protein [Saprospiraceae bacterium]
MKPRILALLCVGLGLTSLIASCGGDSGVKAERMAYIEEQVEERILEYKRILDERCREEVLDEANRLTDSILLVRARLERDSLDKPPRPDKPDKPEVKTIIDSVPVAPLFMDSTELLRSDSNSIQ